MTTRPQYTIRAEDAELDIEITEVGGRHAALLETFGECQEGRCTCPTDEYQKLAAMELHPTRHAIAIRLLARPGMHFDPDAIAVCLDHVVGVDEV